jgi:ABC-type oligopeptide transport system substrate-binding subunit
MKKIITIFSIIFLITALTACSPDFNGSRTGNDNQLIMEYTAFNTTDSQDLVVKAGDTIHAELVIEDGLLSYKIQKNDDEPIAESKGIFFSVEFDVEVEESGTYTITVTGEKAKGSVKFVVESAE